MGKPLLKLICAAVVCAAGSGAWAAAVPLVTSLPNVAAAEDLLAINDGPGFVTLTGLQVNKGTHKVTRLEWWGLLIESDAPLDFGVWFNGSLVAPPTAVQATPDDSNPADDFDLVRFTVELGAGGLDIGDTNVLEVQYGYGGQSAPSEGYWAYTTRDYQLSYRISGERIIDVPEPSSALLVALAGVGLLATRRRPA